MIETARLLLRPPIGMDLPGLFSFLGDPDAMRFTQCEISLDSCRIRIETHERRRAEDGFAPWTVITKDDSRIVGWGGLYHDPFDPGWGPELGYYFHRDAWGHGLASEMAAAALTFADLNLGLPQVGAFAHPSNERSHRLLTKMGFRLDRWLPEMERHFYRRERDSPLF